MSLSTAYWGSQVLLTANRIGLFDILADGSKSAAEVAASLSLDARATALFLNACTALGLCERVDGDYANSAASTAFLVSDSPASMANAIAYSDNLYASWGQLEQALRSGEPPLAPESYLGADDERTRHFVYGMHDRAMAIGRALPDVLDLHGRKRMLDVGGGPGTFSALLTARYPALHSEVLELAGVARVAEEILAETGASDRVTMRVGDYLASDYGRGYDVALMSGMFHRESADNCRKLIGKGFDCLSQDGLLVVSDVFTDNGGDAPEFAALFGINMMLTAPDGGVHADTEVAGWMAEAGFRDIARKDFPPPMPHRIVTGIKP
jgi:hypothetical protein